MELVSILSQYFHDVTPEKDKIDIVFGDWAMEIKTVNTNYQHCNVEQKTRPITENIKGVIKDIENLSQKNEYKHKVVTFLVFPLSEKDTKWNFHLEKIRQHYKCKKLKEASIEFANGLPGKFYILEVMK